MDNIKDKVNAFFDGYKSFEYQKGETVAEPSKNQPEIFYIKSGKVRMYDISKNGNKLTLNVLSTGAFFSLSWIYGSPNKFYFEALESSELIKCPISDAKKFIESNSDVAVNIISRLSNGFDGLFQRLSMHMGGTAEQRLIIELLIDAWRFSKAYKDCRVNLSIAELSVNTGLARETVSRNIAKLSRKGLVYKKDKEYYIKDLNKLEKHFYVT